MKTLQLFSQSWSEVTSGERNAIVFEHLNQSYGAYEIRKNYYKTLFKALSTTTVLILLFSSYLFIASLFRKSGASIPPDNNKTFLILPPKPNDLNIPKLPEQLKTHPAPATNPNLRPEVTTDHSHDMDLIQKKPNDNSTSTSTSIDSTGEGPEIPSEKKRAGNILPVDTLTHTITDVGKIPQFPGGDKNLVLYLRNNIHIPQELIEIGGIKEKVGIAFVVDKDGSIIHAMILQKGSRYVQLNNEAMRVIKAMPKWEPGSQNGNPVKVQMVLPIRFEVK